MRRERQAVAARWWESFAGIIQRNVDIDLLAAEGHAARALHENRSHVNWRRASAAGNILGAVHDGICCPRGRLDRYSLQRNISQAHAAQIDGRA